MRTWAVLVAAGRGERLGEDRPKAFVRLGDLPMLAEPLRRLDESDLRFGTNVGGGIKLALAGPLRLRLDYRVFLFKGSFFPESPKRFYAGLALAF